MADPTSLENEPVATSAEYLALDDGPRTDRLPPMLFLAALAHGILIIGVTFNAIIGDYFSEAVSLEVTIVADPDTSFDRLDDAMYLAQASKEGSGNTADQARPAAPVESSVPIDNPGNDQGNAVANATAREQRSDELLSTRRNSEQQTVNDPRAERSARDAVAQAMEAGADTTLPLPREAQANFLVRDENRQRIFVSADTKESSIAGYVDRWKRKIEFVGQRYLPAQIALSGLTGSPTLEVTIDMSGALAEVVIRRSSGSTVLDQAALNILERAAPFEPFPEAVRTDHPELNFLYKWQFSATQATSTASVSSF